MITEARQGHRYKLHGKDVIALENSTYPKVLFFDPEQPWLGEIRTVWATHLTPQPMKYFHGEVPRS